MRWNCICLGQRFITVLLLVIGLSSYGCKDSVSISEDVQVPLASLTITPGTLQPGFSRNTTNYTVDVSTTVISVTVTAAPKDNTTTMTINGINTNPGQGRVIPLSPSETTTNITIVLTNQNGIQSTYDVVVRKVDNTLSALTVTPPGTFPPPGFSPSTLNYQVDVGSGVPSVTVSATKLDTRAVMSGAVNAGPGLTTGQATIPLNGPGTDTVLSITVAVPNSDAKTYTITVHRAALSGDNNLLALLVTSGASSLPLFPPVFVPSTLDYTVDVATNVTEVTVTATKADPNAVISGDVPNEGQKIIPLDGPGTSKVISITVTAQNTVDSKTYTVTVNRMASNNNNLSALTVTPPGTFPSPGFAPSTLDYSVDVATDVTEVAVTATKADPNAVISGDVPNEGQKIIPLDGPGTSKVISITVTAQNTVDSKTYTVTVNRALPSSDANLSALNVSAGSLDQPFDANILAYTVTNVPTGDTIVFVTATKSDPQATMSALGSPIAPPGTLTGTAPVLVGTTVEITVIAQDAATTKTYTITFNPAP